MPTQPCPDMSQKNSESVRIRSKGECQFTDEMLAKSDVNECEDQIYCALKSFSMGQSDFKEVKDQAEVVFGFSGKQDSTNNVEDIHSSLTAKFGLDPDKNPEEVDDGVSFVREYVTLHKRVDGLYKLLNDAAEAASAAAAADDDRHLVDCVKLLSPKLLMSSTAERVPLTRSASSESTVIPPVLFADKAAFGEEMQGLPSGSPRGSESQSHSHSGIDARLSRLELIMFEMVSRTDTDQQGKAPAPKVGFESVARQDHDEYKEREAEYKEREASIQKEIDYLAQRLSECVSKLQQFEQMNDDQTQLHEFHMTHRAEIDARIEELDRAVASIHETEMNSGPLEAIPDSDACGRLVEKQRELQEEVEYIAKLVACTVGRFATHEEFSDSQTRLHERHFGHMEELQEQLDTLENQFLEATSEGNDRRSRFLQVRRSCLQAAISSANIADMGCGSSPRRIKRCYSVGTEA